MAKRYDLGSVVGRITFRYDDKGIRRSREDIRSMKAEADRFGTDLQNAGTRAGRVFAGLAKTVAITAGAITALSATSATVNGLISVVGGLSGTLGLLPGIALAGAAAIGTLVIGMQGFGEAMKNLDDAAAFEEAIADLAPSAQGAARAIKGLKPAFDDLQLGVQEQLFSGMGDVITRVGRTYLPVLQEGMTGTAAAMNKMGKEWASFATQQQTVADTGTMFNHINTALERAADAVKPFLEALRDIGTVGSQFLPGIADGAANAATRFRDFIAAARESGQLADWIREGINTLRQLGALVSNVFGIITKLFGGLQSQGGGFLNTLVQLTDQFNEFLGQADTQETLGNLGKAFSDVAKVVAELFMTAVQELGPVISALMPAFSQLIELIGGALSSALRVVGPLLEGLAQFWSANATWLNPVILALTTAVGAFWGLSRAIAGVNAAVTGLRTANALIQGAFGVNALTAIRSFGQALITATIQMGRFAAQMVVAVGRVIAQGAILAAQTTVQVAKVIAQWAMMAAQAVARAAVIAAAWLAANPVALIAAAIAAIVALIITNWDHIVAFLTTVWNWIRDLAVVVWNGIRDFFVNLWNGISGFFRGIWNGLVAFLQNTWNNITSAIHNAWNNIRSWLQNTLNNIRGFFSNIWNSITGLVRTAANNIWNAIRNGVQRAYNSVVDWLGRILNWFRNLPGQILSALGNLGSLLFNSGKALLQGLWNGIQSAIGWVKSKISGALSGIRNLFPFSPAKEGPFSGRGYTTYSGKAIVEDFTQAILREAPQLYSALQGMMASAQRLLAAGTRVAVDPMVTAAQEMLKQVTSGGVFFEDFSFWGNSDTVRKYNDQIAKLFYQQTGADFGAPGTRDKVTSWLQNFIASRSVATPVAPSSGASGTGSTIVVQNLTLQVAGNLDPTNKVAWRQAMVSIRDGIRSVEREYA